MEHKGKNWSPEELMQLLSGVLDEGAAVPLVVSGCSMAPFLAHGRDTVYLSKITEPVKRGDIVLYRRKSGDLVLHRVCRVNQNGFSMVGDAQEIIETGIEPEQLLAVTTAVRRKGKLLTPSSCLWKFYKNVWLLVIPWRKKLIAIYAGLTKRR